MGRGEASRIATAAIASSGAATTRASPASTTSSRRLTTRCPPPSRPGLLGEPAPAEHGAIFRFGFEHRDGPVAAGDHLAARLLHGTQHRAEDLTGRPVGGAVAGEEGGVPHEPAAAVEPAKGAGIWFGQGADKVVDCPSILVPRDEAIGGAAPRPPPPRVAPAAGVAAAPPQS